MIEYDVANLVGHAEQALKLAGPSIGVAIEAYTNRNALVVVMLDPRVPCGSDQPLCVLQERHFGEPSKEKWSREFDKIALAKAEVCYRTGESTRTVGESRPYMYLPGDIKFPGGVVCDGLVVAASGLDWQFDEAVAHMVIAFFWASVRSARDKLMADKDSIVVGCHPN